MEGGIERDGTKQMRKRKEKIQSDGWRREKMFEEMSRNLHAQKQESLL